jgi:hypothetical protein
MQAVSDELTSGPVDKPVSEPEWEPVARSVPESDGEPTPEPAVEPSAGNGAAADNAAPTARRRLYRSRSERRTYRRAARKRKSRARLWLVVAPALVVIAAIVALLILLGGPERDESTVTTLVPGPVEAGAILIIEQDGAVPFVVLLHLQDKTGVALAMPGITLLKTGMQGFETVAALHVSGQDEALGVALSEAFAARVDAMASVQWAELRGAMVTAGVSNVPPMALTVEQGGSEQVAAAVLALVGGGGSGSAAAAWEALALEGDASAFRAEVNDLVSAVSASEWTAAELSGNLVKQTAYEYLEPDVKEAKALLSGTFGKLAITLQVQNGSGVVGIAEQAGELLAPLGYTMLPAGNSDDFPDVEQTRIMIALDAGAEGERVRALLGVGIVRQDEALETGHIVVVVGKDYMPPDTTGTTGTTGPAG